MNARTFMKSGTRSSEALLLHPFVNAHAIAVTPPAYGIDFIDRGPQPVLQRKKRPFVIEHSSGSTHEVPGLGADEAEFGASGVSSSLMTPAKPRAGRPITGGFGTELEVDIAFATGVEAAADKEIKALVKAAGKRIDARLLAALRHVSRDRLVLKALETFLKKDKGKLVASEDDRGHYDGDRSPPTISVGIAGGEIDTRSTLIHELLHYVFDRSDSTLAEVKDAGGADHAAIEAIETRFVIIDLVRSGVPPLHEKFDSAFGRFLKGDDLFAKMQDAIAKDDRKGLKALAARADFVKTSVASGLLGEASSLHFPAGAADYHYTAEQFRDLAFIWAQNAAIVRHAMKTAAGIAERTGTPLKDVFTGAEWQKGMSAFLSSFVKEVRKNRTMGVASVEARL